MQFVQHIFRTRCLNCKIESIEKWLLHFCLIIIDVLLVQKRCWFAEALKVLILCHLNKIWTVKLLHEMTYIRPNLFSFWVFQAGDSCLILIPTINLWLYFFKVFLILAMINLFCNFICLSNFRRAFSFNLTSTKRALLIKSSGGRFVLNPFIPLLARSWILLSLIQIIVDSFPLSFLEKLMNFCVGLFDCNLLCHIWLWTQHWLSVSLNKGFLVMTWYLLWWPTNYLITSSNSRH